MHLRAILVFLAIISLAMIGGGGYLITTQLASQECKASLDQS